MVIDTYLYDSKENVITNLAQFDKNVSVYFIENDITSSTKVHFCNTHSTYASVVNGTYSNGKLAAKVPGDLLAQPYPILAFVYVTGADGSEQSIYRARVNMIARPQPDGGIYDGTDEYYEVERLLSEMKGYVKEVNDLLAGYTGTRLTATSDSNGKVTVTIV